MTQQPLRVTPPKDTEAKNGYILIVRATSEDGVTQFEIVLSM